MSSPLLQIKIEFLGLQNGQNCFWPVKSKKKIFFFLSFLAFEKSKEGISPCTGFKNFYFEIFAHFRVTVKVFLKSNISNFGIGVQTIWYNRPTRASFFSKNHSTLLGCSLEKGWGQYSWIWFLPSDSQIVSRRRVYDGLLSSVSSLPYRDWTVNKRRWCSGLCVIPYEVY